MDNKKLLWLMVLGFGLVILFTFVFPPGGRKEGSSKKAKKTKVEPGKKEEVAARKDPEAQSRSKEKVKAEEPGKKAEKPKEEPAKIEQLATEVVTQVEGKLYKAQFSTYGGVLARFELQKMQYREKVKGTKKVVQINLVRPRKAEYLPLKVSFHQSSFSLSEPQVWEPVKLEKGEWVKAGPKNHVVEAEGEKVLGYRIREKGGKAELIKIIRMKPDKEYAFRMDLMIRNLTQERIKERLTLSIPSMDFGESGRSWYQPISLKREAICYVNGDVKVRSYDHITGKEKDSCGGCSSCACYRSAAKSNVFAGTVAWGGIDEKYFLLVAGPVKFRDTAQCTFGAMRLTRGGLMWTDMKFPEREINPNKKTVHRFIVYAGPKDVDLLSAVKPEGQEIYLEKSVDFGILSFLGKPMLWLLRFFQRFVGNWGIAIILITLLIKLLTLYWSTNSMRSMKDMQKLKPMMDELKEKYGNDKQRYQQEVANLWKREKISPVRGCLPMLLQMPIYIAWYQALMAAVELYRQPLFGWIDDLTAPDPYWVMPLLMGAAMFLQQKMSPTTADNTQAKVMMYMMPVMFTFLMLFLPAGLTLYILVNVLLSMLHQWYVNNTQ